MRLHLYTILVTLTLAACGKEEDPMIEPAADFPQAEQIPGKFLYVEDEEIFVLKGQGPDQLTNTCNLNCFKRHPRWFDSGRKISYTQTFEGVFRVWDDGRFNTNVLAFQTNLWTDGAYSRDETLFAASDRSHIYLYSVDEDFDVIPIDTIGYAPYTIGNKLFWSPDGSKILLYGDGNEFIADQLHLLDISTREQKLIRSGNIHNSPSWSPQGDHFAFSDGASLFTGDANGNNLQEVNGTTLGVGSPQWSLSGNQILCGGSALVLYDFPSGAVTKLFDDENVIAIGNTRWSADGQKIAFTMYYAAYQGLYVYQFSDQKVLKLSNKQLGPFEWYLE